MTKLQNASSATLAVKKAVLCRSGTYEHSYEGIKGMLRREPAQKKDVYKVNYPPHIIVKAKDKFAFTPLTIEHPEEDVKASNFSDLACGVVSNDIQVEALTDSEGNDVGEIGLVADIAFYTQNAYDFYKAGNTDTSDSFAGKLVELPIDIANSVGYDFEVTEIKSVDSLALTVKGRGGSSCRILNATDGVMPKVNKVQETKSMAVNSFLKILGIGTKSGDVKLSNSVLDVAKKVGTLSEEDLKTEVAKLMDNVNHFSDSQIKNSLIDTISDSLAHPVEVLAKEKEVSEIIDGLYTKCVNAEEKAKEDMKASLKNKEDDKQDVKEKDGGDDAGAKHEDKSKVKNEDDDEKDKNKDGQPGDKKVKNSDIDIEAVVKNAVAEAVKASESTLASKVDAAVKAALGLSEGSEKIIHAKNSDDFDDVDVSDMARSVFSLR